MFPKSLKGRVFCVLTFVNVGLASYFYSIGLSEQSVLSSISSFLCLFVWVSELVNPKEP